ncbi:APC family permease [Antribacter gilvus]|uniref:APC family permease n=1 Tax=Antribacter gilvus TaxID=2304675 RepID=UPI000F787925|nr:amino acid permease [Antribacter gilvus]
MTNGITVPQGAALTVGGLLGTGVISLPALAAQAAGPASLLAWAALVALSVPLATTFAALGARHPDGGGIATYARLAFGQRVSTMVGWAFYFTIPIGAPAAAGFAAAYVADATGGGPTAALLTTVGIVATCATMSWLDLRVSGTAQLVIAGTIALLLTVAVVVALPHAQPANLVPFAPHGWGAVAQAAALLVWAFAGWEVMGSLSAEYRNPSRDIPRATAIAVTVVGVLYLGVAFATIAVLGSTPGPAPLSDLLVLGFGEAARPVTAVLAVLLTIGAINVYFAGGSRMGASLARDGALPAWLARGSATGQVPRRSLAVIIVLALGTTAVLALLHLPTDAVLLMATGTFSLLYVIAAAAALRLLPRRSPAWWCACVSLVAALGLLAMTGPHMLGPVLLALAGLAWTTWRPRRFSPPAAVPASRSRV